jgi:UrcA family protein
MATCTLTRLSCAAAALLCLTMAATAGASAPELQRHVTVRYQDLDLATMSGATQLYQRIRAAARRVCGEPGQRLNELYAWHVCIDGSVAGAVDAVGSPLLSAVASGRRYPTQTALNR